jgi:predicted nuclease of predicted toxin-antitoxin system
MDEPLRYFMDEHMRPAIAEQLRARGINVETTVETGRAHQGLSDESQLQYASDAGRVLVTEDSDFVALSQTCQPHAGVVYFPVQLNIGACVEYLGLLALTTTSGEIQNMLLYGRW